jgi:hypothetical protein
VISDYVPACLEEESLLDEEGEGLSRYQCSEIIHAVALRFCSVVLITPIFAYMYTSYSICFLRIFIGVAYTRDSETED